MQEAARRKGVELPILKASRDDEIEAAFEMLARLHASALLVAGDAFFVRRLEQIVALASRDNVPAIYAHSAFVTAGGLMSYGITTKLSIARPAFTLEGSSRARSRPICRSSSRPSSSWSST